MSEYEILNLMYLGFTQNGMFFIAMVLLTWLGFRMAVNVSTDENATTLGKLFTSIFCIFVAFFFFTTNAIGGGILESYTDQLVDLGADSGTRLKEIQSSPGAPGGMMQSLFGLFILIFQLAIVWVKRN